MISYFPGRHETLPRRHSAAYERDLLALGLALRLVAAAGLTRALGAFLRPRRSFIHRREG